MFSAIAAIDGGGSKTSAVVMTRDGAIAHLNPASGCNPQDGHDWTLAFNAVLSQIPPDAFTVLGMPGYGEVPANDRIVSEAVQVKIGRHHKIINDVELAYYGAFADADGVLVLSGTGSMAMGRTNGTIIRAGGWGHYFCDEGSGHWIGQRALRHASRLIDRNAQKPSFAAQLSARLDAPAHRFGLLDWVAADPNPRARIAAIARHVDEMEQAGDADAGAILDEAAMHLVELARMVAEQCGMTGKFAWSPAGSVFNSTRLRDAVGVALGLPVEPKLSALGGGLLLASKTANWPDQAVFLQQTETMAANWAQPQLHQRISS